MYKPKKRLFIDLILLSLVFIIFFFFFAWKISFSGLYDINEILPFFIAGGLILIFLIVSLGLLGMILAIIGCPTFSFFKRQAWTAINLLFPLAVMLGKLFDINKEKIESSFIEVSNQIIKNRHIKVQPHELLVLTPHCLQLEDCPHKITRDTNNCKECGKCQIGALNILAKELGFNFAVVTGGTLARQIIKKLKPKAVLAIACERDLTSGIQDIYPLPVVGVLNIRPDGPCKNTRIDVKLVKSAIIQFLK